jgi:quinol monooxygenase YgiN
MMGRFVIVAYKPKPGQESALAEAFEKHLRILREEGFVTEREAYVMRAAEGTLVEVFEWRSAEAIRRAHSSPAVQALWVEFAEACEYVPLASLTEAQGLFAEFEASNPSPSRGRGETPHATS